MKHKNLNLALTLLLSTVAHAGEISLLIAKAQADGDRDLSDEELAGLRAADDAARDELQGAIGRAKAGG